MTDNDREEIERMMVALPPGVSSAAERRAARADAAEERRDDPREDLRSAIAELTARVDRLAGLVEGRAAAAKVDAHEEAQDVRQDEMGERVPRTDAELEARLDASPELRSRLKVLSTGRSSAGARAALRYELRQAAELARAKRANLARRP